MAELSRGRSNAPGRARRARRETYRRILVVAEGETTEKQYVELLTQKLRSKGVNVSVKTAHGASDPVSVVRKAMQMQAAARALAEPYYQSVCLVDVDDHAHLDSAIELAERHGILLLISNVKFELWLLWHVDASTGAKTSRQLDDSMSRHGLFQKKKHLAANFPFERYEAAVRVARRADPDLAPGRKGSNPSTALPILVDILLGKT
ncbi:RloB family protein [Ruicaihuangia caeni]|uniref:RloB family protein n=1 Tax=Ruicaihuangia caeni TaxID=3042517 RepID=UPI003390492A